MRYLRRGLPQGEVGVTAELVCAAGDRGAWLEARRSGVTATDIVTILGLGASSEYALFWEKLGKLPPWEGNARTALGQYLEGYAAGLWQEDHHPLETPRPGALYRSAERPWQLATPDYTLNGLDFEPGPIDSALELKTWDDHDRAAWEDGMPPKVRAQVLWQMDTLGVGTGHVGVLFLPSGEFESRTIIDGSDTWPDVLYMRQVGEAFWARVREGLPPFPDGSPATLAAVKALHAGVCAGSAELDRDLWDAYNEARITLAGAKIDAREAEAALRIEMGDAETGMVGGEPVVKRTRYAVAGKTIERKAYTVDKLTRLGARNGDSDE